MKAKKPDGVEVWKHLEDVLAPRFKLTVLDHAVYFHLLRHTCLEGKLRLRFTISWLANNLGISRLRAREAAKVKQGTLWEVPDNLASTISEGITAWLSQTQNRQQTAK